MKIQDREMAGRYGRALFAAAEKAKAIDEVQVQLTSLTVALKASPEARSLLTHPRVSAEQKGKALSILAGAKLHPLLDRFSKLLLAKKRVALWPEVWPVFEECVHRANGETAVTVSAPWALSEEEMKKIKTHLARALKGTLLMETTVDESLLGGLVIRAGNRRWDNSLKGQLARLREQFLATTH